MAAVNALLETKALSKHFGGLTAVNEVDLSVAPGEIRATDRTERRRQDDARRHDLRPARAELGQHLLRRRGHHADPSVGSG
jgi:hypothetical protein